MENAEENLSEKKSSKRKPSFDVNSLLTIEEVQEILGGSVSVIYRKIKLGIFHPVKGLRSGMHGCKRLLFNPSEVDEELRRVQSLNALRRGYAGTRPWAQELNGVTVPDTRRRPMSRAPIPEILPEASPKHVETVKPKPVSTRAQEEDGQLCAQAVALFQEGKTRLDVVKLMNINFKTAKYFWEEFKQAVKEDYEAEVSKATPSAQGATMPREIPSPAIQPVVEAPLTPDELAALESAKLEDE